MVEIDLLSALIYVAVFALGWFFGATSGGRFALGVFAAIAAWIGLQ